MQVHFEMLFTYYSRLVCHSVTVCCFHRVQKMLTHNNFKVVGACSMLILPSHSIMGDNFSPRQGMLSRFKISWHPY